MPKKIRELKAMLSQAGFNQIPKRGKGSHTVWSHPFCNGSIILSGDDMEMNLTSKDLTWIHPEYRNS